MVSDPMPEQETFQGQDIYVLADDDNHIRIAPQFGARLLTWRCHDKEMIYWPEDADWSRPAKIRGGNPILFPFIARHMLDGQLGKWRHPDGSTYDLPMHGFARDLPFSVIAHHSDSLHMRLQDSPETRSAYPYHFQFDVIYQIKGKKLTVTLSTLNQSDKPMPYYTGHHFYFPMDAAERPQYALHLNASAAARQQNDGSICSTAVLPTELKLDDPNIIDVMHLLQAPASTCQLMKAGVPVLQFDLASNPGNLPWFAVTTWTEHPDASPFFCIEPWLGLPNAIHHGLGLRWLPPGVSESASCSLVSL